jgi:ribosomal protein L30/L7E
MAYTDPRFSAQDISRIKGEIAALEKARDICTDSGLRKIERGSERRNNKETEALRPSISS